MARRGLGRGLGALIPDAAATAGESSPENTPAREEGAFPGRGFVDLDVSLVDTSPWQPRQDFDEEKLQELADSIREQGLVQPVVVRRKGGRYELVAGERRLRAVRRLGEERIPAVLMEASDNKVRELALVENLQRDDLNPIEVARAYRALQQDLTLTHEQIGSRLGVSRAQISNTLRLLDLPEEVKGFVSTGALSAGHARALLALADVASQIRLAKQAVKEGMSVRAVERLVAGRSKANAASRGQTDSPKKPKDPHVLDVEDRIRDYLGTKVTVSDRGGKGSIHIEYYSPGDVKRILDRMGVPEDPS